MSVTLHSFSIIWRFDEVCVSSSNYQSMRHGNVFYEISCSLVAEGLNFAMSCNNHYFAFFGTLDQVVWVSVGCTKIHGSAFSKLKMAAKMAAKSRSIMI